jgi:DNA-binding protein YbaB
MADHTAQLKRIEDKIQVLVKKYQQLQQENMSLQKTIQLKNSELQLGKSLIGQLEEKGKILKLNASPDISGMNPEDKKHFQSLVSEYIREIDKCIAKLSD